MIHSLLYTILKRRHFWRYATFSEVAELYVSRLLRILALHMISLFVAVYLYRSGYSLQFISVYLACYYAVKCLYAFFGAFFVARFGPKHTILLANILYIPALVVFAHIPEAGTPGAIWLILLFALFQGVSATIYDYAYMVTFSKVKNVKHAGKEIGFMQIAEKSAGILSPVMGGLIATLYSPQATMLVAAVLFAVAAVPLLRTGEPTRTKQKIRWRGYPWRTTMRSVVAETGVGFDVVATSVVWSLFLTVIVFAAQGNAVYASLGLLSALGTTTAFVAAYLYGRLIDRRGGGRVLRLSVLVKALSHLIRPFVATPLAAANVNVASEVATTGYSMTFMRGMFDVADKSGYRLTYLLLIEIAANVGATLACGIFALSVWLFDTKAAFCVFFVAAALYISVIATARFALYKK